MMMIRDAAEVAAFAPRVTGKIARSTASARRVRLEVAVNEVERLALRAVAPRAAAQPLPFGFARSARAECSQREHSHHQD